MTRSTLSAARRARKVGALGLVLLACSSEAPNDVGSGQTVPGSGGEPTTDAGAYPPITRRWSRR